jgi:hypothetical protein
MWNLLYTLVVLAGIYGAAVLVGATVINTARMIEAVINRNTDEVLDQLDEVLIQHQATRGYLVEVLEKKLLPQVGYQEPTRSEFEQSMLKHVNDATK